MIAAPEVLNSDCTCISLNKDALQKNLAADVGDADFCDRLAISHPTLLSSVPMFLHPGHIVAMAEIIKTIEATVQLAPYQEAALRDAPEVARYATKAIGVFMGYDFHLSVNGPKLIEINTNAGGALINAVVAKAQKACCVPAGIFLSAVSSSDDYEAAFVASLRSEWQRERGDARLTTIAIVDDAPEGQYLYPEFVLFARLLERHGITTVISAPEDLTFSGGKLWHQGQAIDLVYNRLTSFYLSRPQDSALRAAYLDRAAVVTPNPRAHALFADKRNLVRLTDAELLRAWGVTEDRIKVLVNGIPRTVNVTPGQADALWHNRSKLFFKPSGGFGGKAAYRGDKVTKRVWASILEGGYIAQDLVPPSTRTVTVDGERRALKADIRNYTYDGNVQLIAARLYEGQTTNMRTPGGGFAPVLWDRTGLLQRLEKLDCC